MAGKIEKLKTLEDFSLFSQVGEVDVSHFVTLKEVVEKSWDMYLPLYIK